MMWRQVIAYLYPDIHAVLDNLFIGADSLSAAIIIFKKWIDYFEIVQVDGYQSLLLWLQWPQMTIYVLKTTANLTYSVSVSLSWGHHVGAKYICTKAAP